ncbi:hypothetical protein EXU30_01965 [Shewanella maritima]|uniref:Uncharacterized protein n=2 Tax=Shewanella TaxID=22 RepID=A0A411PDG4_9GAMM|nr:hypothetical protein [Shewanella maritima]QBF81593.1 hypothetical protein EXU30_01965 [Shewanella maritima]
MQIGRLVHKYRLKVVVENICASSCANYVITASHDVKVKKEALVGWHGGATQPLYMPMEVESSLLEASEDEEKNFHEQMRILINEEIDFFQLIGVNQAITILGMSPKLKETRHAPLFSYDTSTLQRLGLNIKFEEDQNHRSERRTELVQVFVLSRSLLASLLTLHEKKLEDWASSELSTEDVINE